MRSPASRTRWRLCSSPRAYSPLVRDLLDFAVVLCNPRGEMVVQGLGMTVHLSALPTAIEAILRKFSGDMRPGDAIIMNDPYEGGMHRPA